jgi:G6PDH family F420-dependent oxidoreductase
MVAASGDKAATLAGRIGDGLISTAPKKELVGAFEKAGGGKRAPRYGQLTVSWARSEKAALETALEWWPTAAVPGELGQELPMPAHFEQASESVTADQIRETILCGPKEQPILDKIAEYEKAGFTHVYIHQVGPDQEGFLRFARRALVPQFSNSA